MLHWNCMITEENSERFLFSYCLIFVFHFFFFFVIEWISNLETSLLNIFYRSIMKQQLPTQRIHFSFFFFDSRNNASSTHVNWIEEVVLGFQMKRKRKKKSFQRKRNCLHLHQISLNNCVTENCVRMQKCVTMRYVKQQQKKSGANQLNWQPKIKIKKKKKKK